MSSETEELSGEDVVLVHKEPFNRKKFIRKNATQLGMIVVFFGLWLFFILAAPETFLSPQIYYAFMSTTPLFAIMAMPLTMVPALGPQVRGQLQSVGASWLVDGFHLVLFLITLVGIGSGLFRRKLAALYAASYFLLILIVDNQGGPYNNESRYVAVMLPFLYLYLVKGLIYLGQLIRLSRKTILTVILALSASLANSVLTISRS